MVQRTAEFSAASLVAAMPPRSALTPAVRLAPWLERGLALAGLLACAARGRGAAAPGPQPASRLPNPTGLGDYALEAHGATEAAH